jgi:hypothetical protein
VHASKAEKAAQRVCAGDLPKSDHLGRMTGFEANPTLLEIQASFVGSRLGIAPHVAAIVAQHAFQNGRPA